MKAPRRRRVLVIAFGASGLALLSGCASLGGNVRGNFSCAAPDGTCAPSATIDDRALATIVAGGEAGDFVPAAERRDAEKDTAKRIVQSQPIRPAPGDPARTRERVMRIVFGPYIDEQGRLHEASAVHAVVASGDWQQAFTPSQTNARAAGAKTGLASLADAVDRAEPLPNRTAFEPNRLPTPDEVAAARARKVDPLGAIKADVSARLAPGASRAPAEESTHRSSHSDTGDPAAKPAVRAMMGSLESGAGQAAAQSGGQADVSSPAISAPGFPAAVAKGD